MFLALPPVELLAPFLLTVAITELTPGPNMGYLALVATRWGRGAGLMSVAGIALGLSVYLACAVAGLAEIIVAAPGLLQGLRWLGVAYLVWLAVESWRMGAGASDGAAPVAAPSRGRLFWRGVLANVLNPKAALFYTVLLPSFVDPRAATPTAQLLVLGAIHLGVASSVHAGIVVTASALGSRTQVWSAGKDRIAGRIMGGSLLLVAAWLAWDARGA